MKKLLIALVAVVVAGGLIALNLEGSKKKGKKVEIARVERATLRGMVEASGRLEPAVSVNLSSDVIGRVVEVHAEEGDTVRQGDLLIRIDPAPFDLRVKSARASLLAVESRLAEVDANLRRARRDYERDRQLHDQDLLPDSALEATAASFDVYQAQLRTARHNVAQAQASVEEAEDSRSKTAIRAPMSGVVIRRQVEVGEVAVSGTLNNQGSLLMTIADLTTMRAEVDVDETDVVNVREGQPAEVEIDAFPDRVFTGEVTEVAHSAQLPSAGGQSQSADYKVAVTLAEAGDQLRPGLSATARITSAEREAVLAVPIQAVVVRELGDDQADAGGEVESDRGGHAGGGNAAQSASVDPKARAAGKGKDDENGEREGVFVVVDDVAHFRPVELGIAGERRFEVVEGVAEGEVVVTGPFKALRKLSDGDAVHYDEEDASDARSGEEGGAEAGVDAEDGTGDGSAGGAGEGQS